MLLLRKPIIVYGNGNRQGSSNTISRLHADYLTFANNLAVDPMLVIYRGKFKPKI
ncbi:MAG TPA: hypothetical protein VEO19_09645 [Terriglobia bacterium]|nr:hypothetical protein [Terriglobia bacterium]